VFPPFQTIVESFSQPGSCLIRLTDLFGVHFCQKRQIALTDLNDRLFGCALPAFGQIAPNTVIETLNHQADGRRITDRLDAPSGVPSALLSSFIHDGSRLTAAVERSKTDFPDTITERSFLAAIAMCTGGHPAYCQER
jgi:hypothetical protein